MGFQFNKWLLSYVLVLSFGLFFSVEAQVQPVYVKVSLFNSMIHLSQLTKGLRVRVCFSKTELNFKFVESLMNIPPSMIR